MAVPLQKHPVVKGRQGIDHAEIRRIVGGIRRQEGAEGIGHGNRLLELHPDGHPRKGQIPALSLHQDWKIFMVILSALFS